MDDNSQKALDDIEKYGRHIIQVMEEGEYPSFSYSIGINKTLGKPDVCVIGLKEHLAKYLINEYYNRLKNGEAFEDGYYYSEFIEGFDVCFKPVSKEYCKEYFGWAIWFYKGNSFKMLQLIYPTTSGVWPWDKDAPEDMSKWQPILSNGNT